MIGQNKVANLNDLPADVDEKIQTNQVGTPDAISAVISVAACNPIHHHRYHRTFCHLLCTGHTNDISNDVRKRPSAVTANVTWSSLSRYLNHSDRAYGTCILPIPSAAALPHTEVSGQAKQQMEHATQKQRHFLLVTYPAQGHINPVLHLAKRLAVTNGAAVTFSTAVSAHRKMFQSLVAPDEEVQDGLVTYIPFSDGLDEGFVRGTHDVHQYLSQFKTLGSSGIASILRSLRDRGRPVDCVVYTFILPWVADVARRSGVPSAQYWIQPATVFAIYYHYFHGHAPLVSTDVTMSTISLPGLPSLQARDLPSFLTISSDHDPYVVVLDMLKDAFETLDRERTLLNSKPNVLMNTFVELEEDALSAVDDLNLIPIGPTLSSFSLEDGDLKRDLFKLDEKGYMEWLDSKPRGSVVYVSFGSIAAVKKEQIEEILNGLKDGERPYLWVLRKDCRWEGLELQVDDEDETNGMVVEWCSQVKVLSHPSVGCFVTHCGWNSIVESLVCGVPTVGVPQWTDQGTNAMLVEKQWGTGVRGEVNGDGVLEREELKRCLDLVMGEGEASANIRKCVGLWRDKAREAISAGGSSYQNIRKYVDGITNFGQNCFWSV